MLFDAIIQELGASTFPGTARQVVLRTGNVVVWNLRAAVILARPKLIQIITPPLGHLDAFIPVVAAIVDPANCVAVAVGQRTFDGVGMPRCGVR